MKKYLFEVGQQLADVFYNQENIKPLNQNRMKTAVEQFLDAIKDQIPLSNEHLEMIESYASQAKEMEKEQIIDAYENGVKETNSRCEYQDAEQYYKEIFKSE